MSVNIRLSIAMQISPSSAPASMEFRQKKHLDAALTEATLLGMVPGVANVKGHSALTKEQPFLAGFPTN